MKMIRIFTKDGKSKMSDKVITLDLREMPPAQRHSTIFKLWNDLKKGETLKIVNDHDPKPLHYQFDAEYKGQFEWEYELSGPVDWMVRITKTA